MRERPDRRKQNKTYAFVSHESAVEAIWLLAARNWQGLLDTENVWLVPDVPSCITSQREFLQLDADVDLASLGIRRRPVDLLVPNKSCYSRGKHARFHVWKDFFPDRSFVRVHDRVFVSTPHFAALQLAMACRASKLSLEEARLSAEEDAHLRTTLGVEAPGSTPEELSQWGNIARLVRATQALCDFMGTYRYIPSPNDANACDDDNSHTADIIYDTKPLVTREGFERYLTEMGSARGIRRARKVARLSFELSASPMETLLVLMLCLPCNMGGFGLPRPQLNCEITYKPDQREILSKEHMFADLCWEGKKVIVEYYGWKEHFGKGPRRIADDAARANSLTSLGWTVFHVTYEQVNTVVGITLLARQVASALGVTFPQASDLELVWRSRLMTLLLPNVTQTL